MAMDHADFIVDEEELMGEEEEDEVEENPDKPMYPALTLAAETREIEQIAVPVPLHRMGPLRRDWPKIYEPIVTNLKLQIRMNTRSKCVELKTTKQTEELSAMTKAGDFVKAYLMGFDVGDALALLRLEELYIDSFEITDVKMLAGDNLARAIGRVVGKDGKTKYTIENTTRTRLVVANNKIHILGSFNNIKVARDAISDLILGSPPGKVYARLRTVSSRIAESLRYITTSSIRGSSSSSNIHNSIMESTEERGSHECKLKNLQLAYPLQSQLNITKTDIKCLNGEGFLLYPVLTPSECKHYMNQANNAGFDELAGYKKNYRNNTRVTAFSQELAADIFSRIKEFLPREVVVDKEHEMELTSEFGTEGTWALEGMNECWRLCKYSPGGLFAPHSDGMFARSRSERSMYTFMIYLNGSLDFAGGETNFLKKDAELSMVDGKYVSKEENVLEAIKPKPGLAIIFLHPHLHEGAVVTAGDIMRSDIMYKKTTEVKASPTEEQALALFHEAQELESSDPMKSADLYRRAFKLSPTLAAAYRS